MNTRFFILLARITNKLWRDIDRYIIAFKIEEINLIWIADLFLTAQDMKKLTVQDMKEVFVEGNISYYLTLIILDLFWLIKYN